MRINQRIKIKKYFKCLDPLMPRRNIFQYQFYSTSLNNISTIKRWWLEIMEDGENSYFGFLPRTFSKNVYGVNLFKPIQIGYHLSMAEMHFEQNRLEEMFSTMDEVALNLPLSNAIALERCAKLAMKAGNAERAEGYLSAVLRKEPDNQKARRIRAQILPQVDTFDDQLLADAKKLLFEYNLQPLNDGELIEQKRKSYHERMVYNTVAMEGSRLKPNEVSQLMRQNNKETMAKQGDLPGMVQERLEVDGMVSALELVENWKTSGNGKNEAITLDSILELHRRLLPDKPEFAGQMRAKPVDTVVFGNCPYVPVEGQFVEGEMRKFVNLINNGLEGLENGLELAALVHFAFVHVHPFFDGNGRLGRILMNIVLEKHGYPPLIIPVSKRPSYFDAIHFGSMGDLRRFQRFICRRMMETLLCFIADGTYARLPWDEDLPPNW